MYKNTLLFLKLILGIKLPIIVFSFVNLVKKNALPENLDPYYEQMTYPFCDIKILKSDDVIFYRNLLVTKNIYVTYHTAYGLKFVSNLFSEVH